MHVLWSDDLLYHCLVVWLSHIVIFMPTPFCYGYLVCKLFSVLTVWLSCVCPDSLFCSLSDFQTVFWAHSDLSSAELTVWFYCVQAVFYTNCLDVWYLSCFLCTNCLDVWCPDCLLCRRRARPAACCGHRSANPGGGMLTKKFFLFHFIRVILTCTSFWSTLSRLKGKTSGGGIWLKIVCGVEHAAAAVRLRPVSEPRRMRSRPSPTPHLVLLPPNISDSSECTTIHCIAEIFVYLWICICVFTLVPFCNAYLYQIISTI